jgi:hypothetical protein
MTGVGALAVVLLSDYSLWIVVLSFWLAMWVILQLVGQGIATAMEQRLTAPPYHLLIKPVDTAVYADGLEGSDVSGACCDCRILSHRVNGEVIQFPGCSPTRATS